MPRDYRNPSTGKTMWGAAWGRFYFIIVSILLLLGVSPFLEGYHTLGFVADLFFVFVFISILYAVSESSINLIVGGVLILPLFISLITKYWFSTPIFEAVAGLTGAAFIVYSLFSIGRYIARQDDVSREVIGAAIVFYLLMGVVWAIVFDALEELEPGSFKMGDEYPDDSRMPFIYYSFVTLTTLGFGDITPFTPRARALSIIEAIIGQLYLVIQIAWLVGMYISNTTDRKNRSTDDQDRKSPP